MTTLAERRAQEAQVLAVFVEDVEWLLAGGEHPARVAARLGLSIEACVMRLRRLGRRDLLVPFVHEQALTRRARTDRMAG